MLSTRLKIANGRGGCPDPCFADPFGGMATPLVLSSTLALGGGLWGLVSACFLDGPPGPLFARADTPGLVVLAPLRFAPTADVGSLSFSAGVELVVVGTGGGGDSGTGPRTA